MHLCIGLSEVHTPRWPSTSSLSYKSHSILVSESQIGNFSLKSCTSMALVSDCVLQISWKLYISGTDVLQQCVRRQLCHQGKWESISDSAPQGSFASTAGMWWGCCKAQKACNIHLKKPRLLTVNAVYCFKDCSILICQKPDFNSRHEKWLAPTKLSNASWILGSEYESFLCGH